MSFIYDYIYSNKQKMSARPNVKLMNDDNEIKNTFRDQCEIRPFLLNLFYFFIVGEFEWKQNKLHYDFGIVWIFWLVNFVRYEC